MTKKAIIYCRVACESQTKNGSSFNRQLELCQKYAKENKYELVKTIRECGSGTKINEGLNEAMTWIRSGKAQTIIALDDGRLSRDFTTFNQIMAEIGSFGGEVKLVNEANDAESSFTKNLMQSMASYYSSRHSELIKRGLAERKRRLLMTAQSK